MPSYSFSAPSLQYLPPTPPEDLVPGYVKDQMRGVSYQQNTFHGLLSGRRADDRSHDYAERYGSRTQPQQQHPSIYYSLGSYVSHGAVSTSAPPANSFYKSMTGPILPPIRAYEGAPLVEHRSHQPEPQKHYVHQDGQSHEVKEERPVGGVSQKLDYDMDVMTDYVTETAHSIIMPNRPVPASFRKWVHNVLSATRLPSSTILLAFDYLSVHMRIAQNKGQADVNDPDLYRMLTTALILGSKFLDDNTFINRSWAEVSGINVAILNCMEIAWLLEVDFGLHRDLNAPHGFDSFLTSWRRYDMEMRQAKGTNTKPANINTNVQRQHPMHSIYSPVSHSTYTHTSPPPPYSATGPQASYPTPTYRYDQYAPCRTSTSTSPASAPHTGPTTPEYYGSQSSWISANGSYVQSRLPPAGYPQSQNAQPLASHSRPSGFISIGYPPPIYASGHGADCFCNTCNRRFMMAPDFGVPQPVVG